MRWASYGLRRDKLPHVPDETPVRKRIYRDIYSYLIYSRVYYSWYLQTWLIFSFQAKSGLYFNISILFTFNKFTAIQLGIDVK